MNHDYAHCMDYAPDCPGDCFRGELVRCLRKNGFYRPVSWTHFEGTAECGKTAEGTTDRRKPMELTEAWEKNLHERTAAAGKSKKQVARECGIGSGSLYTKAGPTLADAFRISRALGCTVEDLIEGADEL